MAPIFPWLEADARRYVRTHLTSAQQEISEVRHVCYKIVQHRLPCPEFVKTPNDGMPAVACSRCGFMRDSHEVKK